MAARSSAAWEPGRVSSSPQSSSSWWGSAPASSRCRTAHRRALPSDPGSRPNTNPRPLYRRHHRLAQPDCHAHACAARLAILEWETLTESFGGPDARDIDGVLLDAAGRLVVWACPVLGPHAWTSADGETLIVTGWGDQPRTQGFVLIGRTAPEPADAGLAELTRTH